MPGSGQQQRHTKGNRVLKESQMKGIEELGGVEYQGSVCLKQNGSNTGVERGESVISRIRVDSKSSTERSRSASNFQNRGVNGRGVDDLCSGRCVKHQKG